MGSRWTRLGRKMLFKPFIYCGEYRNRYDRPYGSYNPRDCEIIEGAYISTFQHTNHDWTEWWDWCDKTHRGLVMRDNGSWMEFIDWSEEAAKMSHDFSKRCFIEAYKGLPWVMV